MGKTWFSREDGFEELDLLQYGLDHLSAASVVLQEFPMGLDSAGYLCHLGFELILKAELLSESGRFPDDHNLENLARRVEEAGFQIELSESQQSLLNKLDQFYTLRYPNRSAPVSIATTDFQSLLELQDHLLDHLPTQCRAAIGNMPNADSEGRLKKGGRYIMFKAKK